MYARYRKVRKKPGSIAAAYSLTMDSPATAAYTISITEGGIRMPRVPPAVMQPDARRTS